MLKTMKDVISSRAPIRILHLRCGAVGSLLLPNFLDTSMDGLQMAFSFASFFKQTAL